MLTKYLQAVKVWLASVIATCVMSIGLIRQMKYIKKFRLAAAGISGILVMFVAPASALAAKDVPCNQFLAGVIKTPLDPIIGAFVGLKTLYPELIAVALVLGFLAYRSRHGKKLIEYGLVLAAAGVFIAAIFAALAHYVPAGC